MVDQKWVVKWRHNLKKKWNYLEEEAQGYLITVNLFCCAQTDRNIRGRFIEPPPSSPLLHHAVVGAWVSFYVRGLRILGHHKSWAKYINKHVSQHKRCSVLHGRRMDPHWLLFTNWSNECKSMSWRKLIQDFNNWTNNSCSFRKPSILRNSFLIALFMTP